MPPVACHTSYVACHISYVFNLIVLVSISQILHILTLTYFDPQAFSHTYRSHAHTHNLTFTPDGQNILTVGGADVSIMQWKLV